MERDMYLQNLEAALVEWKQAASSQGNKIIDLHRALDAEREQSLRHVETAMALRQQLATLQAQQNGVQQKYWQLVNDFNDQKIMLDDTQAQLRQVEGERDRLRDVLQEIAEYWNGSANELAMRDACEHVRDLADAALTPAAGGTRHGDTVRRVS